MQHLATTGIAIFIIKALKLIHCVMVNSMVGRQIVKKRSLPPSSSIVVTNKNSIRRKMYGVIKNTKGNRIQQNDALFSIQTEKVNTVKHSNVCFLIKMMLAMHSQKVQSQSIASH